jgi:GNAT superfamily N-acetyltransferase
MNLRNFFTLTIKVADYNMVATKPDMVKQLRKLTLSPYSGMNHELNLFERIRKTRPVDCQILTAYRNRELVGWALLSREKTTFTFHNARDGFDPADGILFQVFIAPGFRKQGIASELLKVARRKANGHRLCVCPHDVPSTKFYSNFENYNAKHL